MSAQQPGFVGYVFEVESYTEARAIVFASTANVLRYGALALVDDQRSSRRYLALVLDVSERSVAPSIDAQRLQQLSRQVQTVGFQNAQKLLQLLFSPTQSLVQWHGVRELKLRILGEIAQPSGAGGRPGLALPSQPPRPMSLVLEPDPQLLQQLLGGSSGKQLYLGVLAYNPAVRVYLDPERLTMHAAVLGQTGSGKTETVKRLVAEYAWRKHEFSDEGGVIVFDIAGEYTGYPYRRPGTTPLLDAAVNPNNYTTINAGWLANAKKTILVPYDLSIIGFRAQAEVEYAGDVAELVKDLTARYGTDVHGLVYMRHNLYAIDPSGKVSPATREKAAQLLDSSPFLVVAAPLPQTLDVDVITELSHTTSTAFPDILESIADIVGLLDLGYVVETKGLADVVDALAKDKTATGQQLVDALKEAAENFNKNLNLGVERAEREACKTLRGKLSNMRFVDCRALAGFAAYSLALEALTRLRQPAAQQNPLLQYLERVAAYAPGTQYTDPSVSPWEPLYNALEYDRIIAQHKQKRSRQPDKPLYEMLKDSLDSMVKALSREAPGTVGSVARGLQRVARHISPHLDAAHYRLLVERVARGFSIIHLAPPSRGDTDHAVARLLDELFTVSLRGYSPRRRTLTLLVVEEAHNLAPAGESKASKRALLRIAREGRKWGLSLVLVSQRPGFIDQGVLSQTATLMALRITNPDDIAGLRRGSESASQEFIDRLPDLEQGQAVVAGIAVPERKIPLLVKIDMLKPMSPQSRAGQQAGQGKP